MDSWVPPIQWEGFLLVPWHVLLCVCDCSLGRCSSCSSFRPLGWFDTTLFGLIPPYLQLLFIEIVLETIEAVQNKFSILSEWLVPSKATI